ncbi:MAG: hypothetical protein COA79_21880 [Planctomycetota bacterium]|nr:MAG: hypothetical protein COA79_21880 [Planctomycetota bacterium]
MLSRQESYFKMPTSNHAMSTDKKISIKNILGLLSVAITTAILYMAYITFLNPYFVLKNSKSEILYQKYFNDMSHRGLRTLKLDNNDTVKIYYATSNGLPTFKGWMIIIFKSSDGHYYLKKFKYFDYVLSRVVGDLYENSFPNGIDQVKHYMFFRKCESSKEFTEKATRFGFTKF